MQQWMAMVHIDIRLAVSSGLTSMQMWSRLSWSDLEYYHMAWMAVPLKIIICLFSVLFLGLVIFQ